ncbi:hypothetical protein [Arcanobacterium ihumii]|uniref:hypothetical protein n=1 Tax=Arcanobacterium ihumii TaxID=2138162 RepID=UPI000F5405EB|nr:hypothetical protein [Arcanobacterium ihumii]
MFSKSHTEHSARRTSVTLVRFVLSLFGFILGFFTISAFQPAFANGASIASLKMGSGPVVAIGPKAVTTPNAPTQPRPSVVVILTDSINWDYINPSDTPALSRWAAAGTMFNIIPLSISDWTCPVDVSIAMGAGGKLSDSSVSRKPTCLGPSVSPSTELLNWGAISISAATESPHLVPGAVGTILESHGVDVAAIGTQAGIVLANRQGKAPKTYEDAALGNDLLAEQVHRSSLKHQFTVVDASQSNFVLDPDRQSAASEKSVFITRLPLNDPESTPGLDFFPAQIYRDTQAKNNVIRAEQILSQIDPGTTVLFASVQGLGAAESMQAGFLSNGIARDSKQGGNTSVADALGWTPQVRQNGNISFTSLIPTAFEQLRTMKLLPEALPTDEIKLSGAPVQSVSAGKANSCAKDTCFHERRMLLQDSALQAAEIRKVRGGFYAEMTWSTIIYVVAATLFLIPLFRNTDSDVDQSPSRWARLSTAVVRKLQFLSLSLRKRWVANTLSIIGLTISSVPIASHLVTMTYSWWQAAKPQSAVIYSTWTLALIIGLVAFTLFRFNIWLPAVAIASLTGVLLTVDVATGAKVLSDSPMGFNTLLGARFYGLGNEAFALLSTGMFVLAGFVASQFLRRGWNRIAVALVAGTLPLISSIIGVWPTMGADFGGALAYVPSIAVFIMLVSGKLPSMKKLLLFAVCAAVASFGTALIDWMRPVDSRTHLGNFVQSIIDGEAWEIISRKIGVNLRLLVTSTHRWVVLTGIIFVLMVVIPALKQRYHESTKSIEVCTLTAIATCLTIAFVVNDSGIVLPGMGAILLLPALSAGLFQIPHLDQVHHALPELHQMHKLDR